MSEACSCHSCSCHDHEHGHDHDHGAESRAPLIARIIASAVMLVALRFIPSEGYLRFALYMIPYLTIGYDILARAARGILNRQIFDENFLMTVATLGAIAIALSGTGDYTEAVAVMLFYQTGELFQAVAVGKSRRSITELMDIRPDYANLLSNGEVTRVSPSEVEIGSVIVVNTGEKLPLDGVVTLGETTLDTSALTGESEPRTVKPGDAVISGCINMGSPIQVRTTKEFGESTVSKILETVEHAASRKARPEAFITRFARVYTPAVCAGALVLAILPPTVRLVMSLSPDWSTWVYRALTFLVISCPCALVISIPLTFFAAIGGASRSGVLVKGASFLESLSKCRTVAFDKTGTLTNGAEVKPTSARAVAGLKAIGVAKTVMLTGDEPARAQAVANAVGIDEFHAKLLPDDKLKLVDKLLKDKPRGSTLAFVGDGINDAPALSRADIGIAMGALGTDAAIESADVVLMDDDPVKLIDAIKISRRTMGIVTQNIVFALGVKFLCLILGALGYTNMWLAIFADVGVSVLAILNSIRTLRASRK